MAKKKSKNTKVGQMLKSKDGAYYLKFERPVNKDGEYVGDEVFPITINEGDVFYLNKPREDIQFLIDNGHIEEDRGQEIIDNIPDFVKFNIKYAAKGSSGKKSKAKKDDPEF